MYTIKKAAELTGVQPATLRAWEQRYGIGADVRSDGGYRLYSDSAIAAVRRMQQLVASGWSTRSAAAEVLANQVSDPATSAAIDQIVEVARSMDESTLTPALDRAFALGSFEFVLTQVLMPALRRIGDEWASGQIQIAAEHMVSAGILRRLAIAYEAAGQPLGKRVLVGLPANGRHEIPAMAFAVAGRRLGLAVTYLGADLPVDAWVKAVNESQPAAIVMSALTTEEATSAEQIAAALRQLHPALIIAVGGNGASAVSSASMHLVEDIAESAAAVAREVN